MQMQWSKVTDKLDLIALYHPQYGFHCSNGGPCESLVTFTETPGNVSTWTLHLKNVSSSLTGKYECSFTLYPEGFRTKIYNLLLQTNGKHNCRGKGAHTFTRLSLIRQMCLTHQACVRHGAKYTEVGQKEVLPRKEDRNSSHNSTDKCKIATVTSVKGK